jgi:hypothetical protein
MSGSSVAEVGRDTRDRFCIDFAVSRRCSCHKSHNFANLFTDEEAAISPLEM